MRIDEFEFRNNKGQEIEPTKSMLICYIKSLHKDIKKYQQQLAEKDEEIKEFKKDEDWYKMWHNKFKKEIETLKTELETYRPTKLNGNGQCKCYRCEVTHWTDWCNSYKGHIYCDDCLKEIYNPNRDKILFCINRFEEIKECLFKRIILMDDGVRAYLQQAVYWQDIDAIISKAIGELKK